ncbi:hypothetical protein [Bdellovibrio sp. NC01]|uniref:hypothetical protein n=1 Tax=Bdellovibrio sp. NC01 TaxID=2220073 RepID=UPI00115B9A70|nr:hypothetical protein [Bdellovibrio sp. NC01]QDK37907.1 hypothetical protein DOE51_10090 [Bdellovibrio sp. NC01]
MTEAIEVKKTKPVKDPTSEKKPSDSKSGIKKLDLNTVKLLEGLSTKANRKPHGRKIRDVEIIALALTLIEPKHLVLLQENSLSEEDRFNIAHEEYQKTHGKLTRSQFLGKLLSGEIVATKKET